jgi:hypothetical protein
MGTQLIFRNVVVSINWDEGQSVVLAMKYEYFVTSSARTFKLISGLYLLNK